MIRLREELAEQLRALADLKTMAKSYGFDISGPATTAREAVQWTYFGYLGAINEANGQTTTGTYLAFAATSSGASCERISARAWP